MGGETDGERECMALRVVPCGMGAGQDRDRDSLCPDVCLCYGVSSTASFHERQTLIASPGRVGDVQLGTCG